MRERFGFPLRGDEGTCWDKVFARRAAKVRLRHAIAEGRRQRARLLIDLPAKGWTQASVSEVITVLLPLAVAGEMEWREFKEATQSMLAAAAAIEKVREGERSAAVHAVKFAELQRAVAAAQQEKQLDPAKAQEHLRETLQQLYGVQIVK